MVLTVAILQHLAPQCLVAVAVQTSQAMLGCQVDLVAVPVLLEQRILELVGLPTLLVKDGLADLQPVVDKALKPLAQVAVAVPVAEAVTEPQLALLVMVVREFLTQLLEQM